ncbi:AsmA family protein [Vibrio sp. SCSIO 43137]|uniref:AsmA family protein n=1 Tax=Vibrio sp. SCSIO 43137 TaxID=3021011 RepID=UPI002307CB98|nr:AsmA family protein [Vibrio sp. SCSIO 43137]WCE30610.1 AsmA family protein [Vibrio sp. SCSIO 43137]
MKKLLLVLSVPLVAIVIAVAALVFLVDANQFKPLIVEQTKKQTGLDLVIEGDIGWRVFPSVGLSLGKTELKNPQGFKNSNLLKIERVGVDVSVMPLLSRELMIGNVSLDGAEIHLETLKDGRSNLDSLSKAKSEQANQAVATESSETVTDTEQQPAAESQPWKINLAGVSVTNGLLEIRDDAKGSYTKLYDVGLSVSEFVFDQWTSVQFAAKGDNNQQHFTAEGKAEFKLAQSLADYALRDIALDATFKDPTTDISSVKVTLDSFVFDQLNKLTLAVKGKAAEMDIDMSLSSNLQVDKAISKVSMQNMSLNSQLIGASLPQSPMTITADSDFSFDLNKQFLSLMLNKLTMNKIAVDGKASVQLAEIPAIRFSVHSPEIDLDEFLGLNKTEQAASEPATEGEKAPEPAAKEPVAEQEPDLTALKTLDIAGEVTIDKFKANNVHMQNVQSRFSVNRGVVKLSKFHSDLYQGSIDATAYLDGRKVPATYWAKKQIKNVKVQPLLKDAADNDMLEGTGNIDVDVKGSSLKPSAIKKNLAGIIKIKFADGAINGINIAQVIRVNYAKIKGEKVPEDANDSKKTDFSAMGATLKLAKGEMTTNDLSVQSPLLRVHGAGKVNYIDETMDMELNTSIVGSLEGQGGKDIDELRDVTIPVRLYGQWAKPQYDIELDKLWKKLQEEKKKQLEKKAEKELNKFLGEKIKDDETRQIADQLLKGLFN